MSYLFNMLVTHICLPHSYQTWRAQSLSSRLRFIRSRTQCLKHKDSRWLLDDWIYVAWNPILLFKFINNGAVYKERKYHLKQQWGRVVGKRGYSQRLFCLLSIFFICRRNLFDCRLLEKYVGNFLVVQWLEFGAFTAEAWVQSLARELKSHKKRGTAKNKNLIEMYLKLFLCKYFNNSFIVNNRSKT